MRWISLVLLAACTTTAPTLPGSQGPGQPNSPGAQGQPGTAGAPSGPAQPTGGPDAAAQAEAGVEGAAPPAVTDGTGPSGEGAPGPDTKGLEEEEPGVPRHTVMTNAGTDRSLEDATFGCCKDDAYQPVFDGYLQLTSALASDDSPGAAAALAAMRTAITTASALERVDPPAKAELAKIDGYAADMQGGDLTAVRAQLMDLSKVAIIFAQAHSGGETKLVEAYCATDGTAWLQAPGALANPYTGPAQPVCGAYR